MRWGRSIVLGLAVAFGGHSASAQHGAGYCQLIDRIEDPAWKLAASYTARERIEDGKNAGIVEVGAAAELFYFRTSVGDLDFKALADSLFFVGSGGINLPSQVSALRLDMSYLRRTDDGYALKLAFQPGFYSEFKGFRSRAFYVPFSVQGIRTFNESVSALGGLQFYPGFDRKVDPRLGVRWAVSDMVLVDLFYPASQISFRPNFDWTFSVGLAKREFLEYRLKRSDPRGSLQLDEARWYVGVDRTISDTLQLMFEFGYVFNRKVDFDHVESSRDWDDAMYYRIGVGGLI